MILYRKFEKSAEIGSWLVGSTRDRVYGCARDDDRHHDGSGCAGESHCSTYFTMLGTVVHPFVNFQECCVGCHLWLG